DAPTHAEEQAEVLEFRHPPPARLRRRDAAASAAKALAAGLDDPLERVLGVVNREVAVRERLEVLERMRAVEGEAAEAEVRNVIVADACRDLPGNDGRGSGAGAQLLARNARNVFLFRVVEAHTQAAQCFVNGILPSQA